MRHDRSLYSNVAFGSCLLGMQQWLLDFRRYGQTFIFPDSLTLEMICQGYRVAKAGAAGRENHGTVSLGHGSGIVSQELLLKYRKEQ